MHCDVGGTCLPQRIKTSCSEAHRRAPRHWHHNNGRSTTRCNLHWHLTAHPELANAACRHYPIPSCAPTAYRPQPLLRLGEASTPTSDHPLHLRPLASMTTGPPAETPARRRPPALPRALITKQGGGCFVHKQALRCCCLITQHHPVARLATTLHCTFHCSMTATLLTYTWAMAK